jgi:hypothetical protein
MKTVELIQVDRPAVATVFAAARPALLLAANFGLVLVRLAGLVVVLVVFGRRGERSGRKGSEQQGKDGAFHDSVSFQSMVG